VNSLDKRKTVKSEDGFEKIYKFVSNLIDVIDLKNYNMIYFLNDFFL